LRPAPVARAFRGRHDTCLGLIHSGLVIVVDRFVVGDAAQGPAERAVGMVMQGAGEDQPGERGSEHPLDVVQERSPAVVGQTHTRFPARNRRRGRYDGLDLARLFEQPHQVRVELLGQLRIGEHLVDIEVSGQPRLVRHVRAGQTTDDVGEEDVR
jgi:hypothetical protein